MSQRLVAVLTLFEDLTDPRVERSRRHELFDLVVVALCGTLAGSDIRTTIANGTESGEESYFLSRLTTTANTLATLIRQHWSIENELHWCWK